MERKIKMQQKSPQAGKSIRAERYVDYKSLVLVIIGVFHILHSILFSGISDFYCTCVLSGSAEIVKLGIFHSCNVQFRNLLSESY